MSENKSAKTPADGSMAWGCQCGRAYTVTCVSSKPAKQWVSLTDEERREIFDACETTDRGYVLAMVEAKLKERNT